MAALGLLLLAPLAARAQTGSPGALALSGRVEHPAIINLTDLQAMPPVTVEITRATPQGPRTARYTGVPLWALLSAAAPVHEAGPHSALRHTVMVQGRDGYIVALAIGELDPEFEGKQVLVVYAQDDAPLPDLRLVVPGDKRAGRSVRDLVSIEVR